MALSERIPPGAIHQPETREEVALHRFLLGAAEGNAADGLIDYVIALEALLLPERSEGELRFRLALFGAHYVGHSLDERRRLFRNFQTVYDVRSGLVHGAKRSSHDEIQAAVRLARHLAAAVMLKGLDTGWPTQEQLRDLVLD